MRATLHDELMREAGFESDYYVELARRREERRQRLRRDILRTTSVVALIGAVAGAVVWIISVPGKSPHVPLVLWLALSSIAVVGQFALWLEDRMTRDENETRRPGLWKRITRPWRGDAR